MTLPVGMEALAQAGTRPLGPALGFLYGANTLGAVAGALLWEGVLVPAVGVRGAAVCAGGVDVAAAALALVLARLTRGALVRQSAEAAEPAPIDAAFPSLPLLLATAVAGAALLGLETAWFRLLLQFVCGTAFAFAAMLAAVLAGIGLGAGLAGGVLARWPDAARLWPVLGATAAACAALGYATFDPTSARACGVPVFAVALPLAGPTSLASGALFTFLGAALRSCFAGAAEVVGRLTLANTMGALAGGLAAPLVLLPWAGVEGTVFAFVFAYGLVALAGLAVPGRGRRALALGASALWAVAVLAFPSGAMRSRYLPASLRSWEGMTVVAVREGPTETATILRSDLWGQAVAWRLVTNGFSMSAIGWNADRYMRLFSYWPGAAHPNPQRALLISYGVGSTAAALNELPTLRHIDVVDISADILELNRLVRPHGADPLADPRVRVHVEDGRQFLELTGERYDIITGEPPPPLHAGVVNLYSAEYFRLVRDRLAEGGIATYWLPVHSLPPEGARAVVAAFCAAFEDCSLWNGSGFDWMLAGSRGGLRVDAAAAQRLWAGGAGRSLREAGFADPGMLFATFLADRDQLRAFAQEAEPVTDDRPHRIGRAMPLSLDLYRAFMSGPETARRFGESLRLRALLDPDLLASAREALPDQDRITRLGSVEARFPRTEALAYVAAGGRRYVALWLLGVNEDVVQAVPPEATDPYAHFVRGASALADGAFSDAAHHFDLASRAGAPADRMALWPALASCLAGDAAGAQRWVRAATASPPWTPDMVAALPASCRP